MPTSFGGQFLRLLIVARRLGPENAGQDLPVMQDAQFGVAVARSERLGGPPWRGRCAMTAGLFRRGVSTAVRAQGPAFAPVRRVVAPLAALRRLRIRCTEAVVDGASVSDGED